VAGFLYEVGLSSEVADLQAGGAMPNSYLDGRQSIDLAKIPPRRTSEGAGTFAAGAFTVALGRSELDELAKP
jgi:hypothetical protein